ncbi:MAG: ATP-binding cassette domain-containing protein [Chloroflexi bacterium]|nr:ATP-binding cassette domain-containing protein [Chloroflexota bacterium]
MKIELRGITKRFGPLVANDAISMSIEGGQIIGVLGENGAGKSTLMKIVSGYQPADEGSIVLDGRAATYTSPHGAIAAGIGMLHQDPLDVGAFTVLEDFAYGLSPDLMFDRAATQRKLDKSCTGLGFSLDSSKPVATLSIAQRQQLEIARLLALGVRALILDEPTTGISTAQKDQLFEALKALARAGLTVLLVSHKLEDVLALCDRAVVLRHGQLTGDVQLPVPQDQLVALMFGQPMQQRERISAAQDHKTPALSLEALTVRDHRLIVRDLTMTIRPGEVVGLAGLDGSGQALIMRAAAGLIRPEHGHVKIEGADMTGSSYRQFMAAGVSFGAAGRLEEGLIPGLTLTEHLALVSERGAIVDWGRARILTDEQIAHYQIKGQADSHIETLSGGNQQRVLLAMLPETPRLLVLEQPTRGLDVESAQWVWEQLLARRDHGAAILFSSDDLDELLAYSDRIVVCFAGNTTLADNSADMSASQLGMLIGGSQA